MVRSSIALWRGEFTHVRQCCGLPLSADPLVSVVLQAVPSVLRGVNTLLPTGPCVFYTFFHLKASLVFLLRSKCMYEFLTQRDGELNVASILNNTALWINCRSHCSCPTTASVGYKTAKLNDKPCSDNGRKLLFGYIFFTKFLLMLVTWMHLFMTNSHVSQS